MQICGALQQPPTPTTPLAHRGAWALHTQQAPSQGTQLAPGEWQLGWQLPQRPGTPFIPFPKAAGTILTSLGFRVSFVKNQPLLGLVYFVLEFTRDSYKDKDAWSLFPRCPVLEK